MNGRVPHLRVVLGAVGDQRASSAVASEAERLAYMAELILELKVMADKGGHDTLSSILEVAYAEAKAHLTKA
jgi:hypothetical protein